MKIFIFLVLIITSHFAYAKLPVVNYFIIADSATPIQIAADKKYSGIITDLLQDILSKKAIIKTHSYPFKRMTKYMRTNKFSSWVNYGNPKWHNSPQSRRISKEPIYIAKIKLLTLKAFEYKSLKDLYGKTVVLISGFSYPGLDDHVKNKLINAIYVADYMSAIKAVKRKRGVAFVGMSNRLLHNVRELGLSREQFKFHDFSKIIPDTAIHFSYSNDFPDGLFKYIDIELKRLKETGHVNKIIRYYTE